jgi:phage shock protein B
MDEMQGLVAVVAIMMPVFLVLAFRGGRRKDAGGTAADQQQMLVLSEAARKMERRIESLEMLLDTEVPGWRTRSGVR